MVLQCFQQVGGRQTDYCLECIGLVMNYLNRKGANDAGGTSYSLER